MKLRRICECGHDRDWHRHLTRRTRCAFVHHGLFTVRCECLCWRWHGRLRVER